MLKSYGTLVYAPKRRARTVPSKSPWNYGDDWWIFLELSNDLSKFYRWLISRDGRDLYAPSYGTHISINRGFEPPIKEFWRYREGEKIWFNYDPEDLDHNGKHWWIHAYSDELTEIRVKMGLPPSAFKDWHRFHITIGKVFNDPPRKD